MLSRNILLIQTWGTDVGDIVRTIMPQAWENHHVSSTGKWIPMLEERLFGMSQQWIRSSINPQMTVLAEALWGKKSVCFSRCCPFHDGSGSTGWIRYTYLQISLATWRGLSMYLLPRLPCDQFSKHAPPESLTIYPSI